MARLCQEWARYRRHGVPFAVIIADLDNFKSVNDRFGHSIGDQLLQEVGKVFMEQSRDCDLPVRHGGEEFAVLAPGECAEGATHLAERCRQKVEEIRLTAENDTAVQTTASFGVADTTGRSSSEDVIKRADEALYQAKSRGRNRVEQAEPPKDEPVAPGRGHGTVLT
jgi:diguanylate cyclase (GGDEF)-like protein